MRVVKLSLLMLSFLAFILWAPLTLRADEWNEATTLTFNQPVEVPGMVLGPGTYLFKLADTVDRHVVQIYNASGSHLYENVIAIPAYRQQVTDNTVVTFEERTKGSPEAVATWFYPGDNYGEEFVYPKVTTVAAVAPVKTATRLATTSKPPEPEQTAKVVPTTEPVQIAQNTPPPQPPATTAKAPVPAEKTALTKLPKTASPVPALVLIGLLMLGTSVGIRLFSKQSA